MAIYVNSLYIAFYFQNAARCNGRSSLNKILNLVENAAYRSGGYLRLNGLLMKIGGILALPLLGKLFL